MAASPAVQAQGPGEPTNTCRQVAEGCRALLSKIMHQVPTECWVTGLQTPSEYSGTRWLCGTATPRLLQIPVQGDTGCHRDPPGTDRPSSIHTPCNTRLHSLLLTNENVINIPQVTDVADSDDPMSA